MADNGNSIPEMPDNWGEYSRMLGNIPLRPSPEGAFERLESRLDASRRSGRVSRGVRAAAVGLAVAMISLVSWLGILAERGPSVRRTLAPAAEQTDQSPKSTKGRRLRNRQHIRPQTTTAIPVDTSLPREVISQGHPKVPTRSSEATPGMPVAPRSR